MTSEARAFDRSEWPEDRAPKVWGKFDTARKEILTALADQLELVFVVRNYGLLLTTPRHAAGYSADTIPEDFYAVDR